MEKNSKIILIAQRRGSTAATKTGAWRYLLTRLPPLHPGLAMLDKHRDNPSPNWRTDATKAMRMERRADGRARILGYPTQSPQYVDYCAAYDENREITTRRATTLRRDGYGCIYAATAQDLTPAANPAPAGYWTACHLLKSAKREGYDSIGWERDGKKSYLDGKALHVEFYDFAPDGSAIVVCHRRTEATRYGVATKSKTYYLVTRSDDGEIATVQTRQSVARMAKLGLAWGTIVTACATGARPKLTPPEIAAIHTGYKLLAQRNGDPEHLASVWDGSDWDIGIERREGVRNDHEGGLYYYRDLAACLGAVARNSVFDSATSHRKLMLVRVKATGRHILYGGGKYAASRITPIEVLACTI